jgi:hypothetical protein
MTGPARRVTPRHPPGNRPRPPRPPGQYRKSRIVRCPRQAPAGEPARNPVTRAVSVCRGAPCMRHDLLAVSRHRDQRGEPYPAREKCLRPAPDRILGNSYPPSSKPFFESATRRRPSPREIPRLAGRDSPDDQQQCLRCSQGVCGQGQGRSADLPLLRRNSPVADCRSLSPDRLNASPDRPPFRLLTALCVCWPLDKDDQASQIHRLRPEEGTHRAPLIRFGLGSARLDQAVTRRMVA